jgi:hypothetical protein
LARGNVVAGHVSIEAVDDVEPVVKFFGWLKSGSSAHMATPVG